MGLSEAAEATILEYSQRRDVAWQYLADTLVAPLRTFVVSRIERFERITSTRLDTGEQIQAIRLPVLSPRGRQLFLDPDPDQLPLLEGSGSVVEALMPLPRYELAKFLNNETAVAEIISRLDEHCRDEC